MTDQAPSKKLVSREELLGQIEAALMKSQPEVIQQIVADIQTHMAHVIEKLRHAAIDELEHQKIKVAELERAINLLPSIPKEGR